MNKGLMTGFVIYKFIFEMVEEAAQVMAGVPHAMGSAYGAGSPQSRGRHTVLRSEN